MNPPVVGKFYMRKILIDAILPRKGPVTRGMSKRLQEDWARVAEEGPRPSLAALVESSWSLLLMALVALVTGPFLGRIASSLPP